MKIPRLDSGVTAYVRGTCTVEAFFPIDRNGNPYVCCELCPYYRPNSHRCALNGELAEFPSKFIGGQCPLQFEEAT